MILSNLKSAKVTAMKSRDAATKTSLTTLISEIEMIGKNQQREVTDTDCIALIRSFVNKQTEVLEVLAPSDVRYTAAEAEIALLKTFLPQEMTSDELDAAIYQALGDVLVARGLARDQASIKEMGAVMAKLKSSHDGTYDPAKASAAIKKVLA